MDAIQAFHVVAEEFVAMMRIRQNQVHLFSDLGVFYRVFLLDLD
jgi:hypothetical protein